MSTFLQMILARKRVELARRRAALPEAALERLAAEAPPPRDVLAALEPNRLGVIAEVKRASPSKGAIALDLDAVMQARRYAEGGADAISVLTDEEFYHGSLDDLRAIRALYARRGGASAGPDAAGRGLYGRGGVGGAGDRRRAGRRQQS